jgi:ribosomal protein S18 acetylase RimI-like enzyme
MIVRRVRKEEWEVYRTLRLNALRLAPDAFGSRYEDAKLLPDEEWQKRVNRFATDSVAVNFIAFQNEQAVGMVSCFITDKAEMVQMWVEPNGRRSRVGEALVNALFDWLKSASVPKVFADAFESNASALKLYLKMGFVVAERIEDASAEPAKRVELKLERVL